MAERQPATNEAAQWRYALSGQSHGPVTPAELREMLQAGQISPETPVWCDGMADWAPARTVPEVAAGLDLPPPPLSPEHRKAAKTVKNAKVNAITMFVLFVVGVAMYIAMMVGEATGRRFNPGRYATLVLFAELFAAVYLPLRWRTLRRLPGAHGTLGIIGGLGLIVMLALTVVGLAIHFALGGSWPIR